MELRRIADWQTETAALLAERCAKAAVAAGWELSAAWWLAWQGVVAAGWELSAAWWLAWQGVVAAGWELSAARWLV